MSRLSEKLAHLTPIEDWYFNKDTNDTSYLTKLFTAVLGQNNVFSSIYVAFRKNPENSTEEENETWVYTNVGHDITAITNYFFTEFALNYFPYKFNIDLDYNILVTKLTSIYNTNLYKYKKLIELMGYRYNPLFNVDGTELYSNAESLGDSESKNKPKGQIQTENNPTVTHYENPYDHDSESNMKVESKDVTTYNTTIQSFGSGNNAYENDTTVSHSPTMNYKKVDGQWTEDELFQIAAKDNAFGVAFNGPERYFAEKRLRQGNIGVTKSQELVDAQRNVVRFNILDEFFKDIYKDLVVGLY